MFYRNVTTTAGNRQAENHNRNGFSGKNFALCARRRNCDNGTCRKIKHTVGGNTNVNF